MLFSAHTYNDFWVGDYLAGFKCWNSQGNSTSGRKRLRLRFRYNDLNVFICCIFNGDLYRILKPNKFCMLPFDFSRNALIFLFSMYQIKMTFQKDNNKSIVLFNHQIARDSDFIDCLIVEEDKPVGWFDLAYSSLSPTYITKINDDKNKFLTALVKF